MPMDLNIEHLIGYLKELFSAKGIYSTWHRLGNISVSVVHLQNVKKHISSMVGNSYQKKGHSTVNTSVLVECVADKARDLALKRFIHHRPRFSMAKLTPNLLIAGHQKIESSSMLTFNKKMQDIILGVAFDEEEDEIPPMDFSTEVSSSESSKDTNESD
ncbi:hypothetical protein ARMGADRAFT_940691 [Armillaria gallica]|uniref:DUF6589 domain-containing protein n=1 Tax=Armillaria gallica TaxID=47427 RepID=A0A2H3DFZ4_ARMGA|nr:hypothetical protein ARMGADRAFT_940691 [Armillaria gallica]